MLRRPHYRTLRQQRAAPSGAWTLPPSWTPFRYHEEQARLWASKARYRVVPSGRRSGKTEIAKRWVIARACDPRRIDRKYVFACPTRDQAKRIFWADIKKLLPAPLIADISETELTIRLKTRTRLCVVGMDVPERIEGDPLDGIVLDEFANMKERTWQEHVLPALNTPGRRQGWAWIIGVPEGRNHYYDLWCNVVGWRAQGLSWDRFTWKSADILDAETIAELRDTMDPRSFRQEWEGSFESYAGLAYYNWSEANVVQGLARLYDADLPLIVCFDFNTSPGVAAIIQEIPRHRLEARPDPWNRSALARESVTCVIGEVWIDKHSNTPLVCERVLEDWGSHPGEVWVYGDASGGALTTTAVHGSDWTIIRDYFARAFGQRLSMRNRTANPREKVRVNAVNSRILSSSGARRLFVDPKEALHVVQDFDRVETVPGGSGEILKVPGGPLSHLSDSVGYYLADAFPITNDRIVSTKYA